MDDKDLNLPAAARSLAPCEEPAYHVGRTLKTTIYNRGENQPCAWVPDNKGLAAVIVRLLNTEVNAPFACELEESINAVVKDWNDRGSVLWRNMNRIAYVWSLVQGASVATPQAEKETL